MHTIRGCAADQSDQHRDNSNKDLFSRFSLRKPLLGHKQIQACRTFKTRIHGLQYMIACRVKARLRRANASYFLTLFQFWLRFLTPQSGVARNTACPRTPKWLARRPEALRSGGSVWSAVASGIPQSNTIFNKVLKICDTIFL
jgi:hypothetical protein